MSDLTLVLVDQNGLALYINPDDVSTLHEELHEYRGTLTVITMKTGKRHTVTDPLRDLVERLIPGCVLT